MASITGLRGATDQEWYSWSVGTPGPALTEITERFIDNPEALSNVTVSITQCDERLGDQGAILGGVWAPDALGGVVAAQWWAGVLSTPEEDELRSARRYERTIEGRTFDGETTVFSQTLDSLFVDDTEAILTYETQCEGDGSEAYILARAVFFPTWTKDRAVVEAMCPVFILADEFAAQFRVIAESFALIGPHS
ncbi:MAG: hypothetical protein LBN10_01135 [Propionibacteriaceae bacterium]|jgi:hypothetical protein|nr:hypothetical protein [Propionibacteriaceae bacterium]